MKVRKPDIRNPDKPIIFIHIEKTAGTAFINYLHSNVDYDHVSAPYYGGPISDYIGNCNAHGQYAKKLYYGHLAYRHCIAVCPDAYYITLLRHPLQRAISQYKSWKNPANLTDAWAKAITKPELDAVLAVQDMTFQEYVMSENPYITGHIENLMSARLAGRSREKELPIMDTAAEALFSKFHYFGLVDEFANSMSLFSQAFDNTRPFGVPTEDSNISLKYDTSLNAAGRKRLKELNQHDFKLYTDAVKVFGERCKTMPVE